MPNLNVYLVEGFTVAQKARLLQGMTDAVVTSLGAPISSVRIFLIELPKAHICVAGTTLLAEEQAGNPVPHGGPTVHVFLIAGRSNAQKEALIASLAPALMRCLVQDGTSAALFSACMHLFRAIAALFHELRWHDKC